MDGSRVSADAPLLLANQSTVLSAVFPRSQVNIAEACAEMVQRSWCRGIEWIERGTVVDVPRLPK